jgi:hypothetical protein
VVCCDHGDVVEGGLGGFEKRRSSGGVMCVWLVVWIQVVVVDWGDLFPCLRWDCMLASALRQ